MNFVRLLWILVLEYTGTTPVVGQKLLKRRPSITVALILIAVNVTIFVLTHYVFSQQFDTNCVTKIGFSRYLKQNKSKVPEIFTEKCFLKDMLDFRFPLGSSSGRRHVEREDPSWKSEKQ